jgi:hypothetical protein
MVIQKVEYRKFMEEIWKDIPGYEGFYQVSNMGSVRRKSRKVNSAVKQHKGYRLLTEKACAITDNGRGYKITSFKVSGVRKNHYVHRLVAEAFLPNHNHLPQVNHIDGDKSNNQASNLEWISDRANRDHAVRTNLMKFGEGSHASKLTEEQVVYILNQHHINPELNKTQLAKQFNIHSPEITRIVTGKRWRRTFVKWKEAIEKGYSLKRTI